MASFGGDPERVELRCDQDVSRARVAAAQWSNLIGLSIIDRTRAVTAVSEIARNCVLHGGGGWMEIRRKAHRGRDGFSIRVEDTGPGIGDVDRALQKGYSTGSGMGLGLGGAKALCKKFSVDTGAGLGTAVVLEYWR